MNTVLGDRIAKRLVAIGENQSWLARQVGMRQQGMNAIIKGGAKRPGSTPWRPRKLKEIAFWLRTSQEYLLGETDDPGMGDKLPPELIRAVEGIGALPEPIRSERIEVLQSLLNSWNALRTERSSDSRSSEKQPTD